MKAFAMFLAVVLAICVLYLTAEIERLREGIRKHRDEKGNDRCWLDDQRLYALLRDGEADMKLPCKTEFLHNCELYWITRQPTPDSSTVPEE